MAAGDRILSLDGGGIRGLIMLEILDAIEKEAGTPTKDLFDWIGGTSTGGIIALGISTGKPISEIRQMYYQLKDQVFNGSKPYASAPIETLLKQTFGENKVMTDITHPKVLITGVLGDHSPWKLHLFRSYMKEYKPEQGFLPIKPANTQLIWEAARSTSAAPTYFHPYKQYYDGGLLSNNPTLDILTEIQGCKTGPTPTQKAAPGRSLNVVLSLGCGHSNYAPIDPVPDPQGLSRDFKKDIQVILDDEMFYQEVIHRITLSNGPMTDRARAWCEMIEVPFFRLNPLLSEDVPMNCVDEQTINRMVKETKAYIGQNIADIKTVAKLLTKK
ncbi:85/88 kDa calcium-independent phospholipase A2-like [Dreissena polymorpha]|uniref:85/88 kDa calcium-independent phospholipase A2-like n=1 Tax=Dreissena polymorpha TaxID=45954 RepID=UPI00226463E9|nr:85/88 kDa calcium-independent phospholipase A2-like [Dreissena polymorpha]